MPSNKSIKQGVLKGSDKYDLVSFVPDSRTGKLYQTTLTLGAATVLTVAIFGKQVNGFRVYTALTDVRFAIGEDPDAAAGAYPTFNVGNSIPADTWESRVIEETGDIRFISTAGGTVTLELF